MKKLNKTQMFFIAMVLMLVATPVLAQATDAGGVAQNFFRQFKDFANAITGAIFIAGLGIGGAAIFKFKAHSDNAQQVPLRIPMMYAIAAAICIGFVAFMNIGKNTMFGAGAEANKVDGSVYGQIR